LRRSDRGGIGDGDTAALPRLSGRRVRISAAVASQDSRGVDQAPSAALPRAARAPGRCVAPPQIRVLRAAGRGDPAAHRGARPHAPPRTAGVRVCHLTSVHPVYDTRIFEKECVSLVAAGYDVHLVAPAAESKRVRGVTIVAVPPARSRLGRATVTTARVLVRALQIRARVYHLHDPELIPVGIVLRALGQKVIYDAH